MARSEWHTSHQCTKHGSWYEVSDGKRTIEVAREESANELVDILNQLEEEKAYLLATCKLTLPYLTSKAAADAVGAAIAKATGESA